MISLAWRPDPLSISKPSKEVNDLIIQLIELLENQNKYERAMPTTKTPLAKSNENSIKFLVTKIYSTNTANKDYFVCITQLNFEELKTYARAIEYSNAPQQAKAMEKEFDQLKKNKTWIIIPKSEIQLGN